MYINKPKRLLSAVIVSSLLLGCGEDTEIRKPQPLTVSVIEVKDAVETHFRNFKGQVMPAKMTNIAFRINGKINKVFVTEGQFVSKGDLIATLDTKKLRQQLKDTQVNYSLASKQLQRSEKLLTQKMVSQSEYDSLAASKRIAQIRYEQAKNNLKYAKLTAPFTGVISEVFKENFENTAAGEAIISTLSSETVEMKINISDSMLVQFDPYQKNYEVTATFSGNPKEYAVSYYKHTTEPVPETQNYELWFHMAQTRPFTLPGSSVDIKLDIGSMNTSSYEIPFTALDTGRSQGEFYVWKYNNGKVTPVKVKASNISSSGAIVSSGIKAGDKLVNSSLRNLRANAYVKRATEE